jgi:hypothetical protein
MTWPPVPGPFGALIAIIVLVVCIVLMFLRGPDPVLGLIAALAVARLT